MEKMRTIITIAIGLLLSAFLVLAIAGITGLLPHSEEAEKYYVALTALATLILAVGTLLLMWYQSRITDRAAKLQMYIQLDIQYSSNSMRESRHQLARLLVADNEYLHPTLVEDILDFIEMLAWYTRMKQLDYATVANGFSLPVRCYWHALQNYVVDIRKRYDDKSFYEDMEWLNNELEKEYAKKPKLTEKQVKHFLETEKLYRPPIKGIFD